MDFADRPSSGWTCYILPPEGLSEANGTWLPCLPWETCDAGDTWFPGSEEHHVAGTRRCGRPCGPGAPCPFGAECLATGLPYTDYIPPEPRRLCAAPDQDPSWPPDPGGGPAAAEGGLGCWTDVADVLAHNGGSRIAVVENHVYALAWEAGMKADGTLVASHLLQHVPLAPGVATDDVTVVAEAEGGEVLWTWVRESSGRLLVFERPPAPEGPSGEVEYRVLWAVPAPDGAVTLAPSGVKVAIANEEAATLPGARHGCIVRPAPDGDILLTCFPVVGGALSKTENPLGIPSPIREFIARYRKDFGHSPFFGRPSFLAASDRWVVAVTGLPCGDDHSPRLVHAAPFDAEAAQPTGPWATYEMPAGIIPDCQTPGPVLAYRDTLLAHGMSTRLSSSGPDRWVAVTPRVGYPMDWTMAKDLVLTFDLLVLTGPGPLPGRIRANRVIW